MTILNANEYITKGEAVQVLHTAYAEGRIQAKDGCASVLDDIGALKAADVQPLDRWISCKDKMPEEYKTVLVYEKDYGVMIGELEKKFFDTQFFIARKSGIILRTTEVTHWQPLPEPPKDGEQNETD